MRNQLLFIMLCCATGATYADYASDLQNGINKNGVDYVASELASIMNSKLMPMVADATTKTIGVSYNKATKMMLYRDVVDLEAYRSIGRSSGMNDAAINERINALPDSLKELSLNTICNADMTKVLILNGATIAHIYQDQDGNPITTIQTTRKDCGR